MADIKEVVTGLECCYKYETQQASGLICEECPYNKENGLGTCSVKKIVNIEEYMPHKVSETICIKCGHRQIDVRPEGTLLKDLECPQCGETGFIIETGEDISDEGQ